MKQKRVLALILAAVLCVTAFAGCKPADPTPSADDSKASQPASSEETLNFNKEGFPISNEGMEFDIHCLLWPNMAKYGDMDVFKDYEKLSNIHINFTEMPLEGLQEKKRLVFANKEGLPDAFWGQIYQNDDVLNFASQGLIIPLNDLIDQYGPNIKKAMEEVPALKAQMTAPDGNIYALGGAYDVGADIRGVQSKMFINQVWLDKLGAKVPTTPDELYQVLKQMKGKDLNGNGQNDEIPMAIESARIPAMMMPWGIYGSYNVENGKVKSAYLEPGFREGLKWFRKLYTEGLLDVETFTQTWGQLQGKGSGPEIRYGFFLRTACEQVVGPKNAEQYVPVAPLKGPAGQHTVNDSSIPVIPNKFVITCNCKDPAALIRWIDYFYTIEGGLKAGVGPENVAWKKTADGKFQMIDNAGPQSVPNGTSPGYTDSNLIIPTEKTLKGIEVNEKYYVPYAVKEYFPTRMMYTAEEVEQRSEYVTTIGNLTKEATANFITGNWDVESDKDYNNFINELKNVGIEKLVEIEQGAYDRYAAAQ